MTYQHLIKEEPQTLTLLPTHKCTASCNNCCFGCTPKINHIMPYNEMVYHIDESIKHFPSIKLLVISGGECFLLGKDLDRIIKYGTEKGLITRVVTNGYWANSYDDAFQRILELKKNGLKEFNLSTGDDHQKFVKFQNIKHASRAAIDNGISPVIIALESHAESQFTIDNFKNDEFFSKCLEDKTVHVLSASWISFKPKTGSKKRAGSTHCVAHVSDEGCDNLFNGLVINPYSQLLACCGLTVEYNDYLKLGNLRKYSMKDLFNLQFTDLYKLLLYTLGPKYLYEKVMAAQGKAPQSFSHSCAYCIEATKNQENINIVKSLLTSELGNILCKLELSERLKKNVVQTQTSPPQ